MLFRFGGQNYFLSIPYEVGSYCGRLDKVNRSCPYNKSYYTNRYYYCIKYYNFSEFSNFPVSWFMICKIRPNPGRIRIGMCTSGWSKNQNRCWEIAGFPCPLRIFSSLPFWYWKCPTFSHTNGSIYVGNKWLTCAKYLLMRNFAEDELLATKRWS